MGLSKRDLARASAKSLLELGGVFCPPTAPLHLQDHASSLQQLALLHEGDPAPARLACAL